MTLVTLRVQCFTGPGGHPTGGAAAATNAYQMLASLLQHACINTAAAAVPALHAIHTHVHVIVAPACPVLLQAAAQATAPACPALLQAAAQATAPRRLALLPWTCGDRPAVAEAPPRPLPAVLLLQQPPWSLGPLGRRPLLRVLVRARPQALPTASAGLSGPGEWAAARPPAQHCLQRSQAHHPALLRPSTQGTCADVAARGLLCNSCTARCAPPPPPSCHPGQSLCKLQHRVRPCAPGSASQPPAPGA